MTAEKVFVFWGLLVLLVPLAASGMRGTWTRADQLFAACCVLVTFVLLRLVPRPEMGALASVAATIVASAGILGAYLALVPSARAIGRGLAIVVAVADAAALVAIGIAAFFRLDWPLWPLLLLAFAAAPVVVARRLSARGRTA